MTDIKDTGSQQNGFTLVELLVALFIFSLIAVAGVALLRSSADGQIALKARLSGHSGFIRTANLIEADLAQAAPRAVRDLAGNTLAAFNQAAITEQYAGVTLFGFTRRGLSAGNDDNRPALGRIAYGFGGGTLSRISWPMTDGASATSAAAMLDGLQSVTVRFRDQQGNWQTNWSPQKPDDIPRAVELTIKPMAQPEYRLVMLVGSQTRPSAELPENELPPPGSGPI
jgi:general secretion pathway protein J